MTQHAEDRFARRRPAADVVGVELQDAHSAGSTGTPVPFVRASGVRSILEVPSALPGISSTDSRRSSETLDHSCSASFSALLSMRSSRLLRIRPG
ncbi:MAG: hypothetical protein KUG77_17020 [Nannocystaceae bacterium]|nr:hypothetical protein [Nannocystaceae bacterium]